MWELHLLPKVTKWLKSLNKSHLNHVIELIAVLQEYGNELKMPTVKNIGKGLYELRDTDYGYRIYFCYHGKKIIVGLVGGNKSSQQRDIKAAAKLIKDLKNNKIDLH
ncbi:type II toxin-antitoxin system RelE/ParE family toxin [Facilibium subflavum]|uniref:type II toxin-antitoxin system RelE/ParE family toxin n=1 Tax=Facilibium subflavum TaxID=2219058 RepID=UPI000E648778|nr:type II toxin-antitoxin system RelE/ParE family toxin [Facilibium subflavum]